MKSNRPRCRRCGSTRALLAGDGACYEAFDCGVRVGAKGERGRIKRGVEGIVPAQPPDDYKRRKWLPLGEVLAVVRGRR